MSTRLNRDSAARVAALAASEDRTVSKVIERAVVTYLHDWEKKASGTATRELFEELLAKEMEKIESALREDALSTTTASVP